MKHTPQLLTLREVCDSIESSIKNKTIQFLAPKSCQAEGCAYTGGYSGKYHCAVGGALSKELRSRLVEDGNNGVGVSTLRSRKYIKVSKTDFPLIEKLQSAHDAMVGDARSPKERIAFMLGAVQFAREMARIG